MLRIARKLKDVTSPAVLALTLALCAPASAAEKVEVLSVTASSTDGMLMDAVDGDATTAWQNKREGDRDAWLAVHFSQSAKIKGVRLLMDPLGADTQIEIETSSDGETYNAMLRNQHATKTTPFDLVFKAPVNALYLRVRFHYAGKATAPRFRIKELDPLGG
ncbi:MAG: type domain [Cyanobacteria bacterium RYN_339]|nr:type domain [Cyanobacteria bacterium RYN_339]